MEKKGKKLNITTFGKIFFITLFVLMVLIIGLIVYWISGMVKNNQDSSNSQYSSSVVESSAESREVVESSNENQENKETTSTTEAEKSTENRSEEETNPMKEVESAVQVRGYCNTFAGYTAAIIANGGNTTQPDSYFGEAGLDVSITIEDNDDVIIEDFINGEIDFFYMTVNKMAMVNEELKDAGVDVVIPYLTDSSTGGDGIVATLDYNSIMDLQNAKIAVARNSVSQAIPVYLFNKTNLDTNSLLGNFVQYDSTQDAVDAFLRGEVDAVSTWDIATAASAEESKVLFSTEEGEYLVIDALVFNKEFATENPDIVKEIVDGSIAVVNDINSGVNVTEAYDIIRASVPDFAGYDDETMKEILDTSKYLGCQKNLEHFETARIIYTSFCEVWEQLGFETNSEYVTELFDSSYLEELETKWSNETIIEQEDIVAEGDYSDKEALLSKSAQILFEANQAEFLAGYEENYELLDEFVEIAKVFNRTVIVIEGNVSLTPGNKTEAADIILSEMRAERVKEYIVSHGISADRIVVKGNGGDKPIAENTTAEGRRLNRRVDLYMYDGETQE